MAEGGESETAISAFLDGKVVLHGGDSRALVKALEPACLDAVVCDPPYALVSIVKRFGKAGAAAAKGAGSMAGAYQRASAGFMGKQWDTGEVAFDPAFWADVMAAMKPGAHLVAFSGTRSYHRLACAIEDAGFEIRDQLAWVYGSGFPKSHDVAKAIDKKLGAEREVLGRSKNGIAGGSGEFTAGNARSAGFKAEFDITAPATAEAQQWQGWGTALKPAWEPIVLARKPLQGTVAENCLAHGTGALNIDGCRIGDEGGTKKERSNDKSVTDSVGGFLNAEAEKLVDGLGRWPANIVHDGSDEVVSGFPDVSSGQLSPHHNARESTNGSMSGKNYAGRIKSEFGGDSGSASRFFYTAKADGDDRLGSKHPTVKPVDLMQWLVRLVCPKGGTVLDPFAGTGTTGEAAWREGCRAILFEREADYRADIERRMELALAPVRLRKAAAARRVPPAEDLDGGLFAAGM